MPHFILYHSQPKCFIIVQFEYFVSGMLTRKFGQLDMPFTNKKSALIAAGVYQDLTDSTKNIIYVSMNEYINSIISYQN